MIYRELKGYDYELKADEVVDTQLTACVDHSYFTLDQGKLRIRAGYAWDGPSFIAIHTKTFMLASLVHDAYYQMIREGLLHPQRRKYADKEMRRICLEEGMNKFRAWYAYRFVRAFGKKSSKPRKNPRGRIVEI